MKLIYFKILWHTGEKTWVRDEKVPVHIKDQAPLSVEKVDKTRLGDEQIIDVIKPTSAER